MASRIDSLGNDGLGVRDRPDLIGQIELDAGEGRLFLLPRVPHG